MASDIIETLNGITFGENSLDTQAVFYTRGDQGAYSFQTYFSGFGSGGTISNAESDSYQAGFTANGQYYLPVFGSFTISNIENGEKTLWVHGFSQDGQTIFATFNRIQSLYTGYQGGIEGGPQIDEPIPGIIASPVILLSNSPLGQQVVIDFISADTGYAPPPQPCFAEGCRITAATGLVPVEDLSVGDDVITASGAARAIKWIGHAVVHPARHPRPWEVNPVRVKAGAFGAGLPAQDLRLSPGHAVFVDGVLVPVGLLVNGATILQEAVESIRYLHIELDSHDVLLAEGLPCESYLDDGNRNVFANAGEVAELHGRLDPLSWDDACAPMVAAGPQLLAIQQRLLAEAEALGWTRCEVPELSIEADGVSILPEAIEGNSWRFNVPAAETVILRSNAGVLAQTMPGLPDHRLLGVAISSLRINGADIALDSDVLSIGFHPLEEREGQAWRWTSGNAQLALHAEGSAQIDVTVAMVAPSWKRALPDLRIAHAA